PADALAAEIGEDALAVGGDLATGEAGRVSEAVLARWGRIDLLVNNAGTTTFANHEDLDAVDADDFLRLYRLNVVAAFEMVRACVPAMRAAGGGAIVNITSVAGHFGFGSSIPYAASKGALITMTKSLARALAPDIRVNGVSPGYVGTGWFEDRMGAEGLAALDARIAASVPLARAGKGEDIADIVVMLLSDATRHVTGEIMLADAGAHLDMSGSRRPGRSFQ
ncbi:MAG: SDR family oxidoreductase, partial [Sphingomonadaceae bacterium]|nr:SDR family oxidoreductase [Sphingomonadaceae bacterium]